MVCSKCGQELKDGSKFCTKCGAKFDVGSASNKILSYLSIVLSVVGIIGVIITPRFYHFLFIGISMLLITAGMTLAIVALYKQKCKLAFIAGLIPCAYYILSSLALLLPFLRILNPLLMFLYGF